MNDNSLNERVLFFRTFHPGLRHEIPDVLLQVVDPVPHLVDSGQYLLGHVLELILYGLEEPLDLGTKHSKEVRSREKDTLTY